MNQNENEQEDFTLVDFSAKPAPVEMRYRMISSCIHNNPIRFVVHVVLSLLLSIVVVGDSLIIQAIMSTIQNQQWVLFAWVSGLSVVWVLLHIVVSLWRNYDAIALSVSWISEFRDRLILRLNTIPLWRLQAQHGMLTSYINVQCENIQHDLLDTFLYGLYLACQLLLSAIVIIGMNPMLAIIALVLCIPMACLPLLAKRFVSVAREKLVKATSMLNSIVDDTLAGAIDWRLIGASVPIRKRVLFHQETWKHAIKNEGFTREMTDSISSAMVSVVIFAIWIGGGYFVMRGVMSTPQIVAFFSLVGNISVPLFQLSGLVSQLQAGKAVLDEVHKTFYGESDIPLGNVYASEKEGKSVRTRRKQINLISYHNVQLQHRVQTEQKTNGVYTVDISTDQRILVVGASGSGKSSLILPLFGLSYGYSGNIYIDNQNLAVFGQDGIGQIAGYCAQASHIFHASIRENIRMMDESISDDCIMEACKRARIEDFVSSRGLDLVIDNSLADISGGERQRILLARQLVHGYSWYVFDEITSGLDNKTAHELEQEICDTLRGFLMISHHVTVATLSRMDRILLIDNGTIVGDGNASSMIPVLGSMVYLNTD